MDLKERKAFLKRKAISLLRTCYRQQKLRRVKQRSIVCINLLRGRNPTRKKNRRRSHADMYSVNPMQKMKHKVTDLPVLRKAENTRQ